MPAPSLAAANEINELWRTCVNGSNIHLANCPTDEEVAAIIERHVSTLPEEQ